MPFFRTVVLATAVAAAALVVAPAAPALAAGSTGWVRVAHLSPDTKGVDVRLVSLDGTSTVRRLDDVSYGTVSTYWALPSGTYAVAMRAAGSSATSTPVVQTSVSVKSGGASTVAVFGRNDDLRTKIIGDSLTLPKGEAARVRVVQASTAGKPVTVTASPDTTIVSDAAITTVSPYSDVHAGRWNLTAVQGSERTTTTVDLRAGQIASVFVLDDATGGLVLRRVLDSASVGDVPKGYLATGGGFLAHQSEERQDEALAVAGAALLAAGLLTGGLVTRRRRVRA